MAVEMIGGFVKMNDDEVLEHLLKLEAVHGTISDEVIDMAINYPMVKHADIYEVSTNRFYGMGDTWKHVGYAPSVQEALAMGQDACHDSEDQRKVHISDSGLTVWHGIYMEGGLQGNFYEKAYPSTDMYTIDD